MSSLPDKIYFKIGEVAELVDVKTHVLRYWESEFKDLCPVKTKGQHRMYSRRDIEVAATLKTLLHEQGFTISGARKRLKEMGFRKSTVETEASTSKLTVGLRYKTELLTVRKVLSTFLDELNITGLALEKEKTSHATVHQVVPAKVHIKKHNS